MLGKQGWKFLSDPDALVTKVFKAKYFPKGDFLTAKESKNPSLIWRSIWSTQIVINRGSRWKIGDGRGINVWSQPWLRDEDNFKVTTDSSMELRELVVSDLMIPELLEWDEELILDIFNGRDASLILSLPLPNHRRRGRRVWHLSKDGSYTVRSAYRVYMERVLNREYLNVDGNWLIIWGLQVPPKVKHFVWRLGRNVLSTKENLHQRHIQINGDCGSCNSFFESTFHLFVECDMARRCWAAAGLSSKIEESLVDHEGSCVSWLLGLLASITENMAADISMVLWSIWKERNDRVWTDKQSAPEWVVRMGKDLLADWVQARSGLTVIDPGDVDRRPPRPACLKWHLPRLGSVKCNTDAAIDLNTMKSGAGMVIRKADGAIVKYRTVVRSGVWRSKEAEARAIIEALSWMEQEGYTDAVIESDAKLVVDAIRGSNFDSTEFGDLVEGCRSILARNLGFVVEFIKRDGNGVTHALAKHSITTSEPYIGEETPVWMNNFVLDFCTVDHVLN
ncbi:Putative ribonuclease H protein At1g65750 [Linum perenne]